MRSTHNIYIQGFMVHNQVRQVQGGCEHTPALVHNVAHCLPVQAIPPTSSQGGQERGLDWQAARYTRRR